MTISHQEFDNLPEGDGVLILSPEGVILSITLQAERLLRRRLESGQVLTLAEIFTTDHLSQAELAVKEALTAGISRSQLLAQIHLKSDQVLFLKYSVAPLYSPDQEITGAVLTFHDDTLTRAWSAWSNFGLGVTPDDKTRLIEEITLAQLPAPQNDQYGRAASRRPQDRVIKFPFDGFVVRRHWTGSKRGTQRSPL